MQIAITDVDYRADHAQAACVVADAWDAAAAVERRVTRVEPVAPYEPGAFFKRELPCLLAVLRTLDAPVDLVVVDGYVWLDAHERKGLGAHLHEALERRIPIVGVAKTSFAGSAFAVEVRRGESDNPLYVTAVGLDAEAAAHQVARMHGAHRVPTLLREVDRLARG